MGGEITDTSIKAYVPSFLHFFSYNKISKTSIYAPSHKKPSGVPQLIYASRVSLKFLFNILLLLVISSSTIIIIPVSL